MLVGGALVNALASWDRTTYLPCSGALASTKSASVTKKQLSSCRPRMRNGLKDGQSASTGLNEEL